MRLANVGTESVNQLRLFLVALKCIIKLLLFLAAQINSLLLLLPSLAQFVLHEVQLFEYVLVFCDLLL